MEELHILETGGKEYYLKDIVARERLNGAEIDIATLQGKVTDLTYTIDVMEGNELESVGETVKMIQGVNDCWPDTLDYEMSEEQISAGTLGLFGKLGGGTLLTDSWDYAGNEYDSKAFVLKPTKIEFLDGDEDVISSLDLSEVIEKLEDYGVEYNGELYNYVMFGEHGVYYIQNVTLDRESLAKVTCTIIELRPYVNVLSKPIVTDITEYCNDFDPYFTAEEVVTIRVHAEPEDVLPLVSGGPNGGQAMAMLNVEILFEEV